MPVKLYNNYPSLDYQTKISPFFDPEIIIDPSLLKIDFVTLLIWLSSSKVKINSFENLL